MKIIDRLNIPFGYDCRDCKYYVVLPSYGKDICANKNKHLISANTELFSIKSNRFYLMQKIVYPNYVLCEDYENNR